VTVARDITERTRREEEQMRLYRELLERDERLHALVRRALLAREQEHHRLLGVDQLQQLTTREREILRLLGRGLTTRQIAQQLVIVPGTVKSHTERILRKLRVANRAQAAVRAIELGLLEEPWPLTDVPGTGSDEALGPLG
jgi:DNA-binding NarL/FixJ family response regulator